MNTSVTRLLSFLVTSPWSICAVLARGLTLTRQVFQHCAVSPALAVLRTQIPDTGWWVAKHNGKWLSPETLPFKGLPVYERCWPTGKMKVKIMYLEARTPWHLPLAFAVTSCFWVPASRSFTCRGPPPLTLSSSVPDSGRDSLSASGWDFSSDWSNTWPWLLITECNRHFYQVEEQHWLSVSSHRTECWWMNSDCRRSQLPRLAGFQHVMGKKKNTHSGTRKYFPICQTDLGFFPFFEGKANYTALGFYFIFFR